MTDSRSEPSPNSQERRLFLKRPYEAVAKNLLRLADTISNEPNELPDGIFVVMRGAREVDPGMGLFGAIRLARPHRIAAKVIIWEGDVWEDKRVVSISGYEVDKLRAVFALYDIGDATELILSHSLNLTDPVDDLINKMCELWPELVKQVDREAEESQPAERTARRTHNPTEKTRLRFHMLEGLMKDNPNMTQSELADKAADQPGCQDTTKNTVRNTYRAMGQQWPQRRRKRR